MQLPDDFIQQTSRLFGDERFERFVKALDSEAPVSIRLNERKVPGAVPCEGTQVPWCEGGYYLSHRPVFTFDPLLHAGCYYVQEASSMFIDHVLRQYVTHPVTMLDLCAAPGGKSTAARAALPEGSMLVSNEPIRQRASILAENIAKWGHPDSIVTNNYPRDFRKAKAQFDVILCDVPCSGEGMFRKDEGAVREWSLQNVERCWQLQRDIVSEAWQCLRDGGLFIYSTCTFNTKENEENVRWMTEQLAAEVLPMATEAEWGITGSLLDGFDEPVYRFIPGFTRGEGLFMAVMRKGAPNSLPQRERNDDARLAKALKGLNILSNPLAMTGAERSDTAVDLDYPTAISYLRGEALVLPPEAPRGVVAVTFLHQPLGFVKNIGNRANNLYPKEWRIKSTHIPQAYETILRLA